MYIYRHFKYYIYSPPPPTPKKKRKKMEGLLALPVGYSE